MVLPTLLKTDLNTDTLLNVYSDGDLEVIYIMYMFIASSSGPINTDWSLTYRLMYILEIRCRGSTVGLIWYFTSHPHSFSYVGTGLSGLNQCLAQGHNAVTPAMVPYTTFKTVFIESISVFIDISKKPRYLLSYFRHFRLNSSEINI